MRRIIRISFFIGVIASLNYLTIPASAQSVVNYDYDSAGNRTERTWSSSLFSRGQEQSSLIPVVIPESVDTLSVPTTSRKVTLNPNNIPLVLTEDEKAWLNDEFFKSQMAEEEAWWQEYEKQPQLRAVNTTYSVGAIPLQEGVSPTGARTYNLPIPTAAGFKLVPIISLGYNSQASEGWAGYGWDIQGVSCIRLINKNEYYHGEIEAADVNASAGKVFALDGNPLVRNEHPETKTPYPLESARGHILVREEYINGKIGRFRALYPNGITAVFGHGTTSEYAHAFYYLTELYDLDGNKVVFNYYQDGLAGHDRISSIRYGYDESDNYCGEIVFNYTRWIEAPSR